MDPVSINTGRVVPNFLKQDLILKLDFKNQCSKLEILLR